MDSWEKIIPEFTYNPEVPYFDVLVPTMDTVRYGFLFEKLVSVKHPVLFTGTTGVGKSVITKGCLRQLQEKGKYVGTVMNFSAQTSSLRTQEIIESKLEKKRKTILGVYIAVAQGYKVVCDHNPFSTYVRMYVISHSLFLRLCV